MKHRRLIWSPMVALVLACCAVLLLPTFARSLAWSTDNTETASSRILQESAPDLFWPDLFNEVWTPADVVAGEDGTLHMVTSIFERGRVDVYYLQAQGDRLLEVTNLSDDVALSLNPALELMDGVVHVVWQDAAGGAHRILHRAKSGAGWTPAAMVSPAGEAAYAPKLRRDGSGSLSIHWQGMAGLEPVTYACAWSGESCSTAQRLSAQAADAPGGAAPQAATAGTRTIAFLRDGNIWRIQEDGSGLRQVTTTSGLVSDFTWSPDGQWLAFVAVVDTETLYCDIFVIQPDGSGFRRLTTGSRASRWTIDWSGDQIAFLRDTTMDELHDFYQRVAYVTLTGATGDLSGDIENPGIGFSYHSWPALRWSPNGRFVAVSSGLANGIISIPDGARRPFDGAFRPDWRHDSGAIVAAYDGMYAWNPETGVRSLLSSEKGNYPGYSADDAYIAYASPYLRRMNADTSGRTTLYAQKSVFPAWSVEGDKIAFQQEYQACNEFWCFPDARDLLVINRDGSGMRRIVTGDVLLPQWQLGTYGASGRVTGVNGSGVSGVKVTSNDGTSAITDATGAYRLVGLRGAPVTLTPSRAGSTFCPPNRSISVASNAPGQDFTAYGSSIKVAPGYCPEPDAYRFANAKAHTSWGIFRDTFGSENVEWTFDGRTVPKPAAWMYYHDTYKCDGVPPRSCTETGAGGNCSGMSTSSMLLVKQWADPIDFLSSQHAERTFDLVEPSPSGDFWPSTSVSDFIVRYQGYQYGREVSAQESMAASRSLADSVALLKGAIDGNLAEPFVISLSGPHGTEKKCAGHALMPFAYETSGSTTKFYVYDPNSPGEATKYVSITPSTNSWSYDHRNSIKVWQNGQPCKQGLLTRDSQIGVVPLAAWKQHPTPPWPGAGEWRLAAAALNWYEFSASTNASLQVVDGQGRVMGNRDGQLALEIPGSYLQIPWAVVPGQVVSYPERYVLPNASALTLKLLHGDTNTAALDAVVPGGLVSVESRATATNAADSIEIAPDASLVGLTAGSASGGLRMAIIRDSENYGHNTVIDGFSLGAGARAEVGVDTDGNPRFGSTEAQASYGVELKYTGQTSAVFYGTGPRMEAGDSHIIQLNWAQPATAIVQIDHDSDGTIDETVVIKNEVKLQYLPLVAR